MTQDSLLYILTGFVAVSAVALVLQLLTLFGVYRSIRALHEKLSPLIPKTEAMIDSARQTIEQSRKQMSDIAARTTEILDVTKTQLARVDDVVADASVRAKAQLERLELVMDDTMGRVQETVALVHSGILTPLREIHGLTVGLRTAINYFLRGGRPSVAHATQDEEMFI